MDFAFLDTSILRSDELYLSLDRTAPADPERGWVPAYYFNICEPSGRPMGSIDLRIGHNDNLFYGGNIGYRVEPEFRGHHYAAKAVKMLFELARRHDLGYLIITCNPDNYASRRTCELAGGRLIGVYVLPMDNNMRLEDGETEKCIYRFDLRG